MEKQLTELQRLDLRRRRSCAYAVAKAMCDLWELETPLKEKVSAFGRSDSGWWKGSAFLVACAAIWQLGKWSDLEILCWIGGIPGVIGVVYQISKGFDMVEVGRELKRIESLKWAASLRWTELSLGYESLWELRTIWQASNHEIDYQSPKYVTWRDDVNRSLMIDYE